MDTRTCVRSAVSRRLHPLLVHYQSNRGKWRLEKFKINCDQVRFASAVSFCPSCSFGHLPLVIFSSRGTTRATCFKVRHGSVGYQMVSCKAELITSVGHWSAWYVTMCRAASMRITQPREHADMCVRYTQKVKRKRDSRKAKRWLRNMSVPIISGQRRGKLKNTSNSKGWPYGKMAYLDWGRRLR